MNSLYALYQWKAKGNKKAALVWVVVAIVFTVMSPIAASGNEGVMQLISIPQVFRDLFDSAMQPATYTLGSLVVLGVLYKFREFFVQPVVAWVGLNLALLFMGLSMTDVDFAAIVTKPDNVPIVGLIFLLGFFTWLATYKAVENDKRIARGERPLEALDDIFPFWSELAVAGRTDAGAHASGQVVSVAVEGGPPPEHVAEALNRKLPYDVAVRSSSKERQEFDARFSALARAYRYRIVNSRRRSALDRRALWHPHPINVRQLQTAAQAIVGRHNFRAFTPTETEHHRFDRAVLAARWEGTPGDVLEFVIVADSFLRHMVRALVGTMLELEPAQIIELLTGASRDRAGRTASAAGLCLVGVAYTPDDVKQLSLLGSSD